MRCEVFVPSLVEGESIEVHRRATPIVGSEPLRRAWKRSAGTSGTRMGVWSRSSRPIWTGGTASSPKRPLPFAPGPATPYIATDVTSWLRTGDPSMPALGSRPVQPPRGQHPIARRPAPGSSAR